MIIILQDGTLAHWARQLYVDMSSEPIDLVGKHVERVWIENRILLQHPDLWIDWPLVVWS